MALARMRTAEGVFNIIKEDDPHTEVTLHYIRQLILSGKISVTKVGRKKLVNADSMIDYIAHGEKISIPEPTGLGGIRQVRA